MDKYCDALSNMFTNGQLREFRPYCYAGTVGGAKVGVVLATRNTRRFANYALGVGNVENLLTSKRAGKVHEAFIVAADVDGLNVPTFVDFKGAEEFHAEVLAKIHPRTGQTGQQFWTLTPATIASGTLDADEGAF